MEVFINNTKENSLDQPSKILCDSPFTFIKSLRFQKKLGTVGSKIMDQVKRAWKIAFFSE